MGKPHRGEKKDTREEMRRRDYLSPSHLRSRQFRYIGHIGEGVLGDGILAVGVGAGLGVVDLRFVLARNVLLVVLDFARLGTVLGLAARRALPLGRHRRRLGRGSSSGAGGER